MEEKESTVSGSPGGDSYTDSPPPVSSDVLLPQHMQPQAMNIDLGVGGAASGAATMASPPGNSGSSVDIFGKKKRGRPRKYDSDGNLRVPSVLSSSTSSPPPGFSLTLSPDFSSSSSSKRGRGRPPGSGNWQLLASLGELFANTAGGDFTPHVVTVNTGEDVAGKILSFSQKGPRGICVLSANGAVSNVTIRQPGSSGGILTYEGRFEILSLSGSFTVTETGGARSRTGGLSVSLAGPDGRVIGGGVAGLLMAASPIQIVVGSFMPNGFKVHKRKHHREQTMPFMSPGGAPETLAAARPISQVNPEKETSLTPITPVPRQSQAEVENAENSKQVPNPTTSQSAGWNGSETTTSQRPSPDINVSLPNE